MKYRFLLPLAVVALVTPLAISPVAADDAAAAVATTLTGEYVWAHRDNSGELRAVFTPSGARTWDVDFHFSFRGKPHVYSGSAKGNLDDGPLEGTVNNENKRRTFSFSGEVKDGAFSVAVATIPCSGSPWIDGSRVGRGACAITLLAGAIAIAIASATVGAIFSAIVCSSDPIRFSCD